MAKKNMDMLVRNILGNVEPYPEKIGNQVTEIGTTVPNSSSNGKKNTPGSPSKHFTFICSAELSDKVQAIARKEGFSIRALMEYLMRQGIDAYEAKHGKVKKPKSKNVSDVM